MTEEMIDLRINKLKAFVARNNWTISDEDAREYVVLEANTSRTAAENARKREIMLRSMGRKECSCSHCQGHKTGEGEGE